MNEEQKKEIEKFYDDFSKKVNEKVISLEMTCLKASSTAFEALHLKNKSITDELWGLFVFCEKSLYFYVHAWESAMSMMFRQATHASEPEEQILNLSEVKTISIKKIPKKWYDFLFGKNYKMYFEFDDVEKGQLKVLIATQHDCEKVYEKICTYFKV